MYLLGPEELSKLNDKQLTTYLKMITDMRREEQERRKARHTIKYVLLLIIFGVLFGLWDAWENSLY